MSFPNPLEVLFTIALGPSSVVELQRGTYKNVVFITDWQKCIFDNKVVHAHAEKLQYWLVWIPSTKMAKLI